MDDLLELTLLFAFKDQILDSDLPLEPSQLLSKYMTACNPRFVFSDPSHLSLYIHIYIYIYILCDVM